MTDKVRLDIYLADHALAPSREKAKALIMAGVVFVDNQKCDKAGTLVSPKQTVEVRGGNLKYVSRGGLKLEKAMEEFPILLTREGIGEALDFASVDVAFISLKLVLPVAFQLLKENGGVVALIKPQFEAGKEKVGKKGVVKEQSTHIEVVRAIYDFAQEAGFSVLGLSFSPIKGPEGNIEYLIYLKKGGETTVQPEDAESVVACSHEVLDKRD